MFSKNDTKLFNMITRNTIKCICGHSVFTMKPKEICTWCGNYVYKDKKLEFKEKLKKLQKRRINEKI